MKRWTAASAVVAVLVYAAMWIGWVQDWAWLTVVDHQQSASATVSSPTCDQTPAQTERVRTVPI